ncbi:MAG: monomethylamine:corrinoid methyltransferase [Anaerolineae bacterium]|nr:monomethylamine:corrinoid methyltransferase [Anaerolineae bacterium]
MPAHWLSEIMRRSHDGPFMREHDFDMTVAKTARQLTKKYGIRFDPQTPVPWDDDLADRVYQAGLELFLEVGVYNMDTSRIIRFSRDEVEEILRHEPGQVVLGEGKDAVVMKARKVEDTERPIVHSGPTGTPCSETMHPRILISCAQEPLIDCLGAGSVAMYHGQEIKPGTPLEIMGSRRDAIAARMAVTAAGRPGMHINDVAVSLTCAGKMAACNPQFGLRPSDGLLVSQMTELKTNFDQLSRVAFLLDYGIRIVDLMTPLIGGVGGGAEGTAIVSIATHLLGATCYCADYHMMSHTHLKWLNNTDRMGLWIMAEVGQALARNTRIVTLNDIYTVSGPGTEELLYEAAAGAITGTVSGMNIQGCGCTGGSLTDHYTGLEARFVAEVSRAVVGMSRQQANELVLKILPLYEHTFDAPRRGLPFQEVYDPLTVQPKPTWTEPYARAKEKLASLGIHFVT